MDTYLEEEAEAYPLVVLDISLLFFSVRLFNARMRYVHTKLLIKRRRDGVRGMDPAVRVDDILGYLLGVDAVYRVADVLAGRHDQTEGEEDHHRDGVVETEDRGVDVYVGDFDEVLEASEDIQHLGGFSGVALTKFSFTFDLLDLYFRFRFVFVSVCFSSSYGVWIFFLLLSGVRM